MICISNVSIDKVLLAHNRTHSLTDSVVVELNSCDRPPPPERPTYLKCLWYYMAPYRVCRPHCNHTKLLIFPNSQSPFATCGVTVVVCL